MKKSICLMTVLMMVFAFAVSVKAETDFVALKVIEMIKDGSEGSYKGTTGLLRTPKVTGTMSVDTIAERTAGAGVTIDGVLIKDGGVTGTGITSSTNAAHDVIAEKTSGAGVTVDGVLLKDGSVSGAGAFTTLSASGAATLAGALTAQKNVTLADTNNIARTFLVSNDYKHVVTPNAIGAVTNEQVIAVVSTYYTISAAEAVTNTIADASAVGQLFTVINIGTDEITFADAGNLKLSDDAVLGQYDTLTLYAVAVDAWVEIAQQDN